MTIADATGAARLSERLLDGARRTPVLGIAVPDAALAGQVDTDALAALMPDGEVSVLVGREATWELKRGLPPGLDVYGRAARLWWPSPGALAQVEHPRCLLDERLDAGGSRLTSWVAARLADGPRPVAAPSVVASEQQAEQQAVVLEVDEKRAVVQLADGRAADLPARAYPGGETAATRLLRVAQTLRVRVVPGMPSTVSPVWSPGDARARLEAQCPVGSTVRGRVVSLRNHGALVALLPGVVGLLHVSEVAPGWVRHVEDWLAPGAVIAVRILDYGGPRVTLSLLDTDADPLTPSLLPDGPPWLPDEGHVIPAEFAPLATELPAGRGFGDDPVERPEAAAGDERRLLRDAVHDGREVLHDLSLLTESSEQQLAELRSEAQQLLRDLERDLADARERVITTMSGGASALVGSAEEALEVARNEVNRLRRELRTRADALADEAARARAAVSRAERAERVAEEQRRRADLHARTAASLRSELSRYAPESQRLVEAIRESWLRNTTRADRELYPWREPVVGSGFLDSLHRVEGVSLERVHDVCAEVVCGRAPQRLGLAVHPLRSTDASGSPQEVRDDGALAFRASLQSRTSAARRLHFWVLPDGRVELAKVGYHDDFTI